MRAVDGFLLGFVDFSWFRIGLGIAALAVGTLALVVRDIRGYRAEDQADALSLTQVRARFEPDPEDDPTRPAPSPADPGDEDPMDEPLPAAVVEALTLEMPSVGGFGTGGQPVVPTHPTQPEWMTRAAYDPDQPDVLGRSRTDWNLNTAGWRALWDGLDRQRADSDTGEHRAVSVG